MSQEKGLKLEEMELRRGPWTLEEDSLLIHYIARHGEGRWNLLASTSGLKRTGKSCRLRWLNYLKPDVKRGNLSPEEQFLILDLHSKWGNRWSRIAQYLPGRTDNEIKNYWRTRVQKQARQLNIDANSATFRDALRCYWMPRLLEKMVSDTNNTSPPLIQSPTIIPNTTALISQPQEHSMNPQPEQNYFNFDPTSVNYYTEMVDQIEPCTYANTSASTSSAPMEPFVHGMNVDDYLLPYECCMDEDYRSNWVGMNEWSGIML